MIETMTERFSLSFFSDAFTTIQFPRASIPEPVSKSSVKQIEC